MRFGHKEFPFSIACISTDIQSATPAFETCAATCFELLEDALVEAAKSDQGKQNEDATETQGKRNGQGQ